MTPLRVTNLLSGPFTSNGTTTVTVTDASGGFALGDFVTFSNASAVGGVDLNNEYQIQSVLTASTYTITAASVVSVVVGGGGANVYAAYQIPVGSNISVPLVGWGGGTWGGGTWGTGAASTISLRLWTQNNFGEDLIFGYRGGPIYYWDASLGLTSSSFTVTIASPAVVTSTLTVYTGMPIRLKTTGLLPTGLSPGVTYYVTGIIGSTFKLSATFGGAQINTTGTQSGTNTIDTRGILLSSYPNASDVPLMQNTMIVSDASRFVLAFGVNDYGSTTQDPLLIRWSDQESAVNWTPAATNQAGSLRLSHGASIIAVLQARQEILVWTDATMYSLQYLGPPVVWGSQILADNISIIGQNATAVASNVVYWMGVDKFYRYNGSTQTLRCDLLRYIFGDINLEQASQVFASTNEGFNEVWWFYCSAESTVIDSYVVYNYVEDGWYYGSMGRTAWIDSGVRNYPIAATYVNNLVNHELGVDDNSGADPLAIEAFIQSAEFDIDDGHQFGFVWRMLPDITFRGSTAVSPAVTMYLYPLANAGSGYNVPASQGGINYAAVTRTSVVTVEQFTGQVYIRVRGRQMSMQIISTGLGVQWQLGSPRIDIRPDGRR
jgi:hypothetical protein